MLIYICHNNSVEYCWNILLKSPFSCHLRGTSRSFDHGQETPWAKCACGPWTASLRYGKRSCACALTTAPQRTLGRFCGRGRVSATSNGWWMRKKHESYKNYAKNARSGGEAFQKCGIWEYELRNIWREPGRVRHPKVGKSASCKVSQILQWFVDVRALTYEKMWCVAVGY